MLRWIVENIDIEILNSNYINMYKLILLNNFICILKKDKKNVVSILGILIGIIINTTSLILKNIAKIIFFFIPTVHAETGGTLVSKKFFATIIPNIKHFSKKENPQLKAYNTEDLKKYLNIYPEFKRMYFESQNGVTEKENLLSLNGKLIATIDLKKELFSKEPIGITSNSNFFTKFLGHASDLSFIGMKSLIKSHIEIKTKIPLENKNFFKKKQLLNLHEKYINIKYIYIDTSNCSELLYAKQLAELEKLNKYPEVQLKFKIIKKKILWKDFHSEIYLPMLNKQLIPLEWEFINFAS